MGRVMDKLYKYGLTK
nr:hypothetical protein [Trichormus azollae]